MAGSRFGVILVTDAQSCNPGRHGEQACSDARRIRNIALQELSIALYYKQLLSTSTISVILIVRHMISKLPVLWALTIS
jgi:hypothetical protein